MGYVGEKLLKVEFIIDTDVGYYEMGELEGLFQDAQLENYIKRFGHEKLCTHLAFLQFQVWSALRRVNAGDCYDTASEKSGPGEL